MLITSLIQAGSPATGRADDDCKPIIVAAQKAIADQKAASTASQVALQKQIEATSLANKQLADDDAKLQSWTRNPFFVSALGFFVGVLATGYALRR